MLAMVTNGANETGCFNHGFPPNKHGSEFDFFLYLQGMKIQG
jgi:hypothetical protein